MFLHEFQSKKIFKNHDILIPNGIVVKNFDNIKILSEQLKTKKVIVKAQIHSGARKKAGGIFFIDNNYKLIDKAVRTLLGSKLVTNQTDFNGKLINYVLIEEVIKISKEFYFSFFIDRKSEIIILLISSKGGCNVEAQNIKDFIVLKLDLLFICHDYQIREVLEFFELDKSFFIKLKKFIFSLFRIFITNDCVLLEINPLVIFNDNFMCLDAKIEIDDNSLCRQSFLKRIFDNSQKDIIELKAEKYDLSYISLCGNIGCIVNGAGLAMATMDIIKLYGGSSANFLDIGGDATEQKVFRAFEVILLKNEVNCIFINIFGGIVRCDLIATSVIKSVIKLNIKLPLVIRFVGNMSKEALNIIKNSALNITVELNFALAVKKVIKFSKR